MANSVDPDQTAPLGAVCSGSTLFAYLLNPSVMLGNQSFAAEDLSRLHFQMHFFLGALRVKIGILKVQDFVIFELSTRGCVLIRSSMVHVYIVQLIIPHCVPLVPLQVTVIHSFTFVLMLHCMYFLYIFGHLGDKCIKNFHLGRYIVGYTVRNLVLRRQV